MYPSPPLKYPFYDMEFCNLQTVQQSIPQARKHDRGERCGMKETNKGSMWFWLFSYAQHIHRFLHTSLMHSSVLRKREECMWLIAESERKVCPSKDSNLFDPGTLYEKNYYWEMSFQIRLSYPLFLCRCRHEKPSHAGAPAAFFGANNCINAHRSALESP